MRIPRDFPIFILILFLIMGFSACSGTKPQLKKEPAGEISKEEASQPKTQVASSQPAAKGGPASAQASQLPPTSSEKTSPVIPQDPFPLIAQQSPALSGTPPPMPPIPSVPLPPAPGQGPPPAQPPLSMQPAGPLPAPPGQPPQIGRPGEPRMGQGIVFNFDNADLYEVIRVIGEIMKVNYLIDSKVKGTVNIHTSGQISAGDIFPIFQSILQLNGATAVKREGFYEIVPLTDAKKMPVPPSLSKDLDKTLPEEKYTIQIVSLKYIPASEATKIVKPFLSDGAEVTDPALRNIIIIGDIATNIRKALDILNLFDIDIFTDLRVRIYPILNADATDVASDLEKIFASFEVSTKSAKGLGITFNPIKRNNSILVVSSMSDIFPKVEGWLKELDRIPSEGMKWGVFVYYVQNGKAKDLSEVLKQVFVAGKEKQVEFKERAAETPALRGVRPAAPAPAPVAAAPGKEEGGAVPIGEINIVVDETTNSLVIRAFARDYRSILETIRKLDIYPKQVLIEVMVANITLDNINQFGIEWGKFITTLGTNAQSVVVGAQPPTSNPFGQALGTVATLPASFQYSIVALGGRVAAAIQAAAIDNRLNVISSPHILASNNKEAKIQVGFSQPILSNTYTTTAAANSQSVIEGSIEYKDIGIIVAVTPRISDGGLVTLDINIEDSTVSTTTLGTQTSIPVFAKKTAKTTLSVLEGQMIVIGGMIEDSRTRNKSGVPLLSRIPLLGSIFGTQDYEKHKTELMILMTPHIITSADQSKTITEEFKNRVDGIKKEMGDVIERSKKK